MANITPPASVAGMQNPWIRGMKCISGTAMQAQQKNTAALRTGTTTTDGMAGVCARAVR